MSRICFVSYEIHPTVMGGCGVLLFNAVHKLLPEGHEIIFLLDITDPQFQQFTTVDRLNLPNADHCRAYQLDALAAHSDFELLHFSSTYEYQSYRFHVALQKICKLEKLDTIEFVDYCGVGYAALCSKIAGSAYQDIHIAVRLHNSMELIDREQPGNFHDQSRYLMYNLEHHALRLAETVLYPSKNYLSYAYQPYYEKWFGSLEWSQPPLLKRPSFNENVENPNIVLFYSRMVGFKGVDRFVDAAILYLSDSENPRREFHLVGYDSFLPPNTTGSYKDYLINKIPPAYRSYFNFHGQLTWDELGKILPHVLFAAIPSYYESFCYAAHELYEARIPLLLSPIPGFHDYFQNGVNAVIFDGSTSDLAVQMKRLSTDPALREKITHPYPVATSPLGLFYAKFPRESWVRADSLNIQWKLLIIILCERPELLAQSLDSLHKATSVPLQVVIAQPVIQMEEEQAISWFLGNAYVFKDLNGNIILSTALYSLDALLILEAGDQVSPEFFKLGISTLQRQSEITSFGCWKEIREKYNSFIECTSTDASPELHLIRPFHHSRFILRTNPGTLLLDFFDQRAGQLGEVDALWKSNTQDQCGVVIPLPLITIYRQKQASEIDNHTDFILIRDTNFWRKNRLARFILTIPDRKEIFQKESQYFVDQYPHKNNVLLKLTKVVIWFGSSRLSRWMNALPVLKKGLRKIAERTHILEPKK